MSEEEYEAIDQEELFRRFLLLYHKCGKSGAELARRMGVSRYYISYILSGSRTIGPSIYNKMGYEAKLVFVRKIPEELTEGISEEGRDGHGNT